MEEFYGPEQSAIHDVRFGGLAVRAADHVTALLASRGVTSGTWLDLGCGSGILARAAGDRGFDVVGVDVSSAMLDLARARAPRARFVQGSAYDVDLPPAVAVTATGEVLGYLVAGGSASEVVDRLAALFARLRGVLAPAGVLVLDLAGPGRHGPSGSAERVHEGDGWLLAMTTRQDEEGAVLERRVTIFARDEDSRWHRVDERQRLRLLAPDEVLDLLAQQGFEGRVRSDYGGGEGLTGWAVFEALPRQE